MADQYYDVYDEHGIKTYYQIKAGSAEEAKTKLQQSSQLGTGYYSVTKTGHDTKDPKTTKVFASGGLVDFTGPAWVDGTPSKPEAFLSSIDTKMINSLINALNYIRVDPGIVPSTSLFGNNTNVGDINITINQAELKDDADYEDVARRVGKAFTKELSKSGFNLTSYNL